MNQDEIRSQINRLLLSDDPGDHARALRLHHKLQNPEQPVEKHDLTCPKREESSRVKVVANFLAKLILLIVGYFLLMVGILSVLEYLLGGTQ